MQRQLFTPEELEELRRFDAEIDAAPLNFEDWKTIELVEALLSPDCDRERAKRREYNRRYYEHAKEKRRQYSRKYRAAHRESEAERKKAWYQANRGRVLAQQKAYRQQKAAAK